MGLTLRHLHLHFFTSTTRGELDYEEFQALLKSKEVLLLLSEHTNIKIQDLEEITAVGCCRNLFQEALETWETQQSLAYSLRTCGSGLTPTRVDL